VTLAKGKSAQRKKQAKAKPDKAGPKKRKPERPRPEKLKPEKPKLDKLKPEKLDKKTVESFRKILLKERERIIGDVKQMDESSKEMGQDGIQDIGDEAATIYNKQILLTLNESERMRLRELDESLDRIESGTYGICEECGEPVGLKRLEVRPVAKYCVPCLTKLEKGKL
jgi:RNA polymerase-binding transcription factor